jgi:glycosyltransferase involved in cell wall biosynthesis
MAIKPSSLITVVITCYNHGRFLSTAIESVLAQNYQYKEIIVVDDGSTDNTKEIASQYSSVRYVYQANQGLSAARNKGIAESSGNYILFLDADDWLLPNALSVNYKCLENHPNTAFVSGGFEIVKESTQQITKMQSSVEKEHFNCLLEFNYISMVATVLFRRWVFEEVLFDSTLQACEDYDIYLKIARKYPVLHHTELIAAYRFHETNMSYNTLMMVDATITTIKRQEPYLTSKQEHESLRKGIENWKLHYSKVIYGRYLLPRQGHSQNRKNEMHWLWLNNKSLYFRFYLKKIYRCLSKFLSKE